MNKPVFCPYCHFPAEIVGGDVIYPHRPDLAHKNFWRCVPCDARVGCHPPADGKGGGNGDGTKPMGRLANAETRAAKQAAHAAFDPLWKSGAMRRREAYAWLAGQLGMEVKRTHIGYFNADECRKVVAAVESRNAS